MVRSKCPLVASLHPDFRADTWLYYTRMTQAVVRHSHMFSIDPSYFLSRLLLSSRQREGLIEVVTQPTEHDPDRSRAPLSTSVYRRGYLD